MAKGSTMVLPPNAAARVPLSKSSAIVMPGPEGCAKCTWLSMPPGSTSRPVASTISAAAPRSLPSAAMRPPAMPTSQAKVSAAVATVPPRMIVSNAIDASHALSYRCARCRCALPVKPDLTINAQHCGGGRNSIMNKLVACLETFTVYLVIAGALIGSALGAVDQFYPLY